MSHTVLWYIIPITYLKNAVTLKTLQKMSKNFGFAGKRLVNSLFHSIHTIHTNKIVGVNQSIHSVHYNFGMKKVKNQSELSEWSE